MIIKGHTSFIGETGYNCHSRNFFKALNKLHKVQIRNYTVGSTWKGYSDEPHNDEYYIDDSIKTMLIEQSLHTPSGIEDFSIYKNYPNDGGADVHIVLNETNHHYFYHDYPSKKIAYNVWETTLQPNDFFERLKTFDQVWVPSKWQKDCTVKQGISEHKVRVVPEGVDVELYKPNPLRVENQRFRFLLVGRWDYRKATKEIIETFINTFSENDNVELLLNIDNPFANDGMSSTEERLTKYNLNHPNITVLHHLSKEDYVTLLKSVDVFVSCARGEGWNLPLIEAMACGVPSIYSNWGGQLEFAEGRGVPVEIVGEVPANVQNGDQYYSWSNNATGDFAEPDFDNLSKKMRDVKDNYELHKKKALEDSEDIRRIFTWDNAALIASEFLNESREDVISIVLSRADTSVKKRLLKECMQSIDTPVILSSNYPVDSDVQQIVDYCLYSKGNPILLKDEYEKYGVGYYEHHTNHEGETTYTPFEFEHSYAVYLLARKGLEVAKSLGKKIVHIINYDCEISKDTLLKHEYYLEENDLVVYIHDEWGFDTPVFCTAFMSGKLDSLIEYFTTYNNKHEFYSSLSGFNILEFNITKYYEDKACSIVRFPISILKKENKYNQHGANNTKKTNSITINYIDGPFVEIRGEDSQNYYVEFINKTTGNIEHSDIINNNCWIKANRKYYTDWLIRINGEEHVMDLKGKRVFICIESSALGDNLAWMPYIEEFRKKHKCHIICSTFKNELFRHGYPDIEFVKPGEVVHNIVAQYRIGWYYNDDGHPDLFRNPSDFRTIPLQKTAADILGLEYEEIRPKLKLPERNVKKQVSIAIHGTCQAKYWNNPTGWQEVVDYLKSVGYEVILLSKEEDGYMGNKHPMGVTKLLDGSLEDVIKTLRESEFFIGISSGLSWLAWACEVPVYLISGFSKPYTEMTLDTVRIGAPDRACSGCFNRCRLDAGDWNWCPDYKNTPRQFECSRLISGKMIINHLKIART